MKHEQGTGSSDGRRTGWGQQLTSIEARARAAQVIGTGSLVLVSAALRHIDKLRLLVKDWCGLEDSGRAVRARLSLRQQLGHFFRLGPELRVASNGFHHGSRKSRCQRSKRRPSGRRCSRPSWSSDSMEDVLKVAMWQVQGQVGNQRTRLSFGRINICLNNPVLLCDSTVTPMAY